MNHTRTKVAPATEVAAATVMKFQALFFILILTCTYLCLAQGSYSNCCIGYVRNVRKNLHKHIKEYRIQETDGDCNLPAVVFSLPKSKSLKPQTICANPQDDWVKKLKSSLDLKLSKNKAQ